MALIDNAEQALSVLGQATDEYKGTRKDHAYIEAALQFIRDALCGNQEEDVKPTE